MTDPQPSELTAQLLFLGTTTAVLLSGALLFAAGLSAPSAALAATATVMALLVLPGRLALWVLGSALFLAIAILPYRMYFQFATEPATRITVLAVTTDIFLLLWFATTFGSLKTRHE